MKDATELEPLHQPPRPISRRTNGVIKQQAKCGNEFMIPDK
jgi:hypothetical protein